MKKTLLTVLLIVILVAGLFVLTGCGEKKEENKTNNTTAQNTASNGGATQQLEATEFYIQNLCPNVTITAFSSSISGQEAYTPNLLGELQLAYGTQAKIGLGITEANSKFDFKVTDEEGTSLVFKSVDLSQILANKGGSVALQVDEEGSPVAVVK